MTLSEYNLRTEAYSLARADETEMMAHLAIFNRKAQDYDPKTKVYTIQKASDLADVKALEKELFEEPCLRPDVRDRLWKILRNLEEYHKIKGGDEGWKKE